MPPPGPETTPPIPTPEPIESPPITVDPGQPVRVTARFPGAAPFFSYMAPGEVIAVHDPGHGKDESRIKHLGEDLYRYTIDTRRMRGGEGWWYFYSESDDPDQLRAKLGRFTVREAPRALVDRDAVSVLADSTVCGYEALARTGSADIGERSWLWLATGALIGFLLAHARRSW